MTDYVKHQIRNANKNPVFFNITSFYTVNNVSAKLEVMKMSGNIKRQVTATLTVPADGSKLSPYVILRWWWKCQKNVNSQGTATSAVLADGSKLSPYVIPNHETMPKKIVRCKAKGWMTSEHKRDWLVVVWNRQYSCENGRCCCCMYWKDI